MPSDTYRISLERHLERLHRVATASGFSDDEFLVQVFSAVIAIQERHGFAAPHCEERTAKGLH